MAAAVFQYYKSSQHLLMRVFMEYHLPVKYYNPIFIESLSSACFLMLGVSLEVCGHLWSSQLSV